MHYLISPIGISDGSFAAEEVPGGADKIFRARHQPRPGKLDSSGVGKPPLLLRRWGKVIREWDLRKARKAFIFSRFRATRRHWNSCLRVLPLYHGQNNFCKKINVTRMNIWMDRKGVSAATFVQEYFNVRYSYFSFSSIFFSLLPLFPSPISFQFVAKSISSFALVSLIFTKIRNIQRYYEEKKTYRWFTADGRVREFMGRGQRGKKEGIQVVCP